MKVYLKVSVKNMWLSGLSQIATTRGFSDLTSHASNSSEDKKNCISKGKQRDVVYLG
jgi:hypothetical protein